MLDGCGEERWEIVVDGAVDVYGLCENCCAQILESPVPRVLLIVLPIWYRGSVEKNDEG